MISSLNSVNNSWVVRCILFFILFVHYSYLFSIKIILLVLIKTPDWVQAMTSKRFYFQETEEELAEAEEYKEARTVLDSVKLEGWWTQTNKHPDVNVHTDIPSVHSICSDLFSVSEAMRCVYWLLMFAFQRLLYWFII